MGSKNDQKLRDVILGRPLILFHLLQVQLRSRLQVRTRGAGVESRPEVSKPLWYHRHFTPWHKLNYKQWGMFPTLAMLGTNLPDLRPKPNIFDSWTLKVTILLNTSAICDLSGIHRSVCEKH